MSDWRDRLPDVRGRIVRDAELAPYTWFRVGGPADLLQLPTGHLQRGQELRHLVDADVLQRGTEQGYRGVRPRRGVLDALQPGVPRLWVYGREGLPCLRCRTLIRRSIEGRQARSTWWCPRCQPTG